MNKKVIFSFFIGATVGSLATWRLLKTKYEQIAQEEIDSVKETFLRNHEEDDNYDNIPDESEPINGIDEKPALSVYTEKLKEQGYLTESKEGGTDDMSKPFVISPEEYGEIDDHELYSYTYYADKVLTDENNEPIDNVDEMVGLESLNHFGEYGDDSVYVRNEERKADYEILLDDESYKDLFPRPMEEE